MTEFQLKTKQFTKMINNIIITQNIKYLYEKKRNILWLF